MSISLDEFLSWLDTCDRVRFARVATDLATREQVERYLPGCYQVVEEYRDHVIIAGADVAGWTLDNYVLPRLSSGLIQGQEIPPARVAIYHNTSRDAFFGLNVKLEPGTESVPAGKREALPDERHPLVKVFEYRTYLDNPLALCERAFAAFNGGSGREDPRYFARRLRSLSVGDVVAIDSYSAISIYSCESAGFKERSVNELNVIKDFDPVKMYGDSAITVPWEGDE